MNQASNSKQGLSSLQKFVSNQPEFDEAFSCLKKNAEISVLVAGQKCMLKSTPEGVKLLESAATNAESDSATLQSIARHTA